MNTVEYEREKYRRMWTEVSGYRNHSPGERLVGMFLELADWEPSDSLIDVGCGPGRAGLALSRSMNVTLFDITHEAPDPEARGLPFIEGCLWTAALPLFDWAYCCDVLEHIPTQHVDASLDTLKAISRKGAFMQIALWAEGWGNSIGETLHLTVESKDWWREKIDARWSSTNYQDSGDGRLIVLAK